MAHKKTPGSDYCIIDTPKQSRLSKFERLTLLGGDDLDRALQSLSEQFSCLSSVNQLGDLEIAALRSAAEFYGQEQWRARPALFYAEPKPPSQVTHTAVHGLSDGLIEDLTFVSCYQVRDPAFDAEYHAVPENLNVHARAWLHSAPSRGCVVALHGWSMGDQRVNSLAFLPGVFYQVGFDVVLFELPYHGRRRHGAAEAPLFPSANMVRTNEAIAQAISDLRELTIYLRSKGHSKIGCVGMSLGAYIGSLWASLDSLDFFVPIVPLCEMAEMAWAVLRNDARFSTWCAQGLSSELLHQIYAIHSPLSFASPATARENIFIVAGIGDQIVPPRQPKLLWDHWKRPKMSWFGGGHAAQLKRREALEQVLEFVQARTAAAKNSS